MDIWIITAILVITTVLLITEKIPIDLTAIGIMVVLSLSGILTYTEAFSGFANPAVITVGAMFFLSRAMIRTGVVGVIGQKVVQFSRGQSGLAMLVVMLIVAVASAFINNTPVVVLFIPVMMSMGCRFGISPSKYLIPLSYVSILAGTCTLIGTSTNIIVSNLADQYGYGALGMFELAKAGAPIAVIGIIFILVAGPRLLPDMLNPACELDNEDQRRYLAEVVVPQDSELIGLNPCTDLPERYPGIQTLELIRYSHIYHPCRDEVTIVSDDLLLVKGSPDALVNLINDKVVALPLAENGFIYRGPDETAVVELIIPPSSGLIGQKLKETDLVRDDDLHIIAIERSGLHYGEKQIQNIHLKTGDILLIWCRTGRLSKLRGRNDWIVAEDVHQEIVFRHKAPLTALIFAAMVVSATAGLANIMVCALAAVFLMVLTGCLPLKEAYQALQGDVLMLIAGTIALGLAMDKTGASQFYAEVFLKLLEGFSPVMILGGFILLTSISTQILSNNATAVLLLPIAISTALNLGVNPKPFIMAVVFGASACFATPIGYQTNLMVYGPGGYRFSDYFKLGIPLNLLVVILGTILVPRFWPF
ncbi:SLC13 family permease [Desulfobacteraceae bacterium SEEP-SAG9]|nr:SLC13 family permease [Desulfobacteraceae bacterium SEEP-SAG9]